MGLRISDSRWCTVVFILLYYTLMIKGRNMVTRCGIVVKIESQMTVTDSTRNE